LEDQQDIAAHLAGGIPDRDLESLAAYWQVLPAVREALFTAADDSGCRRLRLEVAEIKATILEHEEFARFRDTITALFAQWRAAQSVTLTAFEQGDQPKALIKTFSESLLAAFQAAPLLDGYDVYQHVMDYWAETMQDDLYQIAADGWVVETHRVVEEVNNGKKKGESKDKGWACDLIPKQYIVARYFAAEQQALEEKQADLAAVSAELIELQGEHGGDEGVLNGVVNKADATEAYREALLLVWAEQDKKACDHYRSLMEQATQQEACLRELLDHVELIEFRKKGKGGKRGKPKIGEIKKTLASSAAPSEILKKYTEAYDESGKK